MSNEQKWALLWNDDVQFGFVCGAFAGVIGLVLVFFALDLLAWLVTRRRPQQAPQQRVARYSSQGGPNGQSWRR